MKAFFNSGVRRKDWCLKVYTGKLKGDVRIPSKEGDSIGSFQPPTNQILIKKGDYSSKGKEDTKRIKRDWEKKKSHTYETGGQDLRQRGLRRVKSLGSWLEGTPGGRCRGEIIRFESKKREA